MMKNSKKMKYKIFLFGLLLFYASGGFAEDFSKEREISRSFKIMEKTDIQISNKYGNIQVINWEKDSVMFVISISVKGTKLAKVNKTFNYIDVDIKANDYYIIANTVFENERNNFWTDVSDITNSIFRGGSNTQIDYMVYMPGQNNLRIKNKFGNIYLTNRDSATEIELSNGDLKANDLNAYLKMDLSYGTANIKNAQDASIKINYGDLRIKSIQDLNIESRSSNIDCDKLNKLNLVSKRDKLYLGDVNRIDGRFSFSELEIDYLMEDLKLDTNFGDLNIAMVDPGFSNVNIYSSNTDIEAVFDKSIPYAVEISFTKRTSINLPSTYKIFSEKKIGRNKEDTLLKANSGDVRSDSPFVEISQKSGSISITHK